jgi:DNA-binding NarL/FixJ family response regulator
MTSRRESSLRLHDRRTGDRRQGDRLGAPRGPRIVIADDHALLLEALTLLLTPVGQVVKVAQDGAALLAALDTHEPDLIITDLSMPGTSGFDVLRAVHKQERSIPVLVLTVHADIGTLRTAMAAGAAGYLVKSAASAELAEAVRTVLRGEPYIPPVLREAYAAGPKTGLEQLSVRQRAVLDAVATGRSNKQIAAQLGITERTVAFHKEQLRKRLGAQSAVEMVDLLRRAAANPESGEPAHMDEDGA